MINIDSLQTPSVLQELDYEAILNQNIANFKTLVPDWEPLESDEFSLVLEAFAYRELHLRAEFNKLNRAFFLSTSTGTNLDNYAVFYGIERLMGAKPYARYEFSLTQIYESDITILKGLTLIDEANTYESVLLEDVVIKVGELKAQGIVELQVELKSSKIKTELITTPLPFVVSAKAKESFANGSTPESDTELRARILLSMADKSTAGSEESYKSFTFKADERIEDVVILNGGAGVVAVYYFSMQADAMMQERIEAMLNKKEVRPLTDKVVVAPAIQIPFNIKAELKILPNQENATVYNNALSSLEAGLKRLQKIGIDITLSEINDFLRVAGVKEVVISEPTSNIVTKNNEIGVNSANTITYSII